MILRTLCNVCILVSILLPWAVRVGIGEERRLLECGPFANTWVAGVLDHIEGRRALVVHFLAILSPLPILSDWLVVGMRRIVE
jgi:hypothetical protein